MKKYNKSNQFPISKPIKKTAFSLYYGKQLILENKQYGACVYKQNKLKTTGNYNNQVFSIK